MKLTKEEAFLVWLGLCEGIANNIYDETEEEIVWGIKKS